MRIEQRITRMRGAVMTAVLVLLFLSLPTTTARVFEMFDCVEIEVEDGDSKFFLYADMREQCWTPQHLLYACFAGAVFVFYVLGAPGAIYVFIYKKRANIGTPAMDRYFLFLYSGYRKETFWYEAIANLRKMLLAGVIVFARNSGVFLQSSYALMVILGCLGLLLFVKPYKSKIALALDILGAACLYLVLTLSALLAEDAINATDDRLALLIFQVAILGLVAIQVLVGAVIMAQKPAELAKPIMSRSISFSAKAGTAVGTTSKNLLKRMPSSSSFGSIGGSRRGSVLSMNRNRTVSMSQAPSSGERPPASGELRPPVAPASGERRLSTSPNKPIRPVRQVKPPLGDATTIRDRSMSSASTQQLH